MEDYVTYEQAVKLKELGFDWECNHYYHKSKLTEEHGNDSRVSNYNDFNCIMVNDVFSAPTFAQAQKWLREVKGIHIWVESELNEYNSNIVYNFYIFDSNRRVYLGDCDKIMCQNTYEESLSAGIDKMLEILKEQENGNKA